jgi:hypothetical protein
MLDAIIPEDWTHMLYMAAETVRDRTAFEFREFQFTWMACAAILLVMGYLMGMDGITIRICQQQCHHHPHGPLICRADVDHI